MILLLVISLCGNSFADCRQQYKMDIQTRAIKLDKGKKLGRILTVSSTGGMVIFWGYMGIMLVGPLGVLIGLEFGVLGTVVGLPFYVINKIRKMRLKKMGESFYLIDNAYRPDNGDEGQKKNPYQVLLKKLHKKHPSTTLEQLKLRLRELNNSSAYCDGRMTGNKKLATPQQIFRFMN